MKTEVHYAVKVSISRETREAGELVRVDKVYTPAHLHGFKNLKRAVEARDYLFGSKLIRAKMEAIDE